MPRREIDYLEAVLNANVYDVADETPLQPAPLLSERLGNRFYVKREDLQPIFSFKVRGAYNKMSRLAAAELKRGVVAASAGNHAQGVALAAQRLGTEATIVMPITTPRDQDRLGGSARRERRAGGRLLRRRLCRGDADRATAELTFVHPYDDPDVIAGQGTVGDGDPAPAPRADRRDLRRGRRRRADRRYRGLREAPAARRSASSASSPRTRTRWSGRSAPGRRVTLPHVGLFADGVAVKQVGRRDVPARTPLRRRDDPRRHRRAVRGDEGGVRGHSRDRRARPRRSASRARSDTSSERGITGRNLVTVLCGANMNFDRLRFVAERADLGEAREAVFAATIPERPGSFKTFCRLLGRRNITEFNYRFADPTNAHVFVGVSVRDHAEKDALLRKVERAGIRTLDLTDNELAKLHVRHLVGGPATAPNELLYRFEFPDRPGALMQFLDAMSQGWNISLFHYRNHGADYGRVLAGIQVPPAGAPRVQGVAAEARLSATSRRPTTPRRACFSPSRFPARAIREQHLSTVTRERK